VKGCPKVGQDTHKREISVAIMSLGVNTPALHVPIHRGFAGVVGRPGCLQIGRTLAYKAAAITKEGT
jgi:hypothetical protein